MIVRSLIVLLLSAFLVMPVYADRLFKVVDEDGNVTYQTAPPSGDEGTTEQREISGGEGPSEEAIAMDRATANYPVTLFAIKNCKPCDNARAQLQARKIPFEEKDPTSRFTVGFPITDDLSLTYSIALDETESQLWILDYQIARNLWIRAIQENSSQYTLGFSHRFELDWTHSPYENSRGSTAAETVAVAEEAERRAGLAKSRRAALPVDRSGVNTAPIRYSFSVMRQEHERKERREEGREGDHG